MPPETTRTEASRLTKSQQLLWAGQQLSPKTPLYNMAFAFHVDGELRPDVFRAAFHDLVAECDALRMVVDSDGGVPRRRTMPPVDFVLPVLDVTDRAAPDQDAAAWLQASCERPFALDQQMFASALLKLAPDRWIWFLGQHHLICDAWSVSVLFERLGTLYTSRLTGEIAPHSGLSSFDAYARIESAAPRSGPAREHWQKISREAPSPPRLYGVDDRTASTGSQRLALPLGRVRLARLLDLADQDGFRSLSREMSIFQVFATVLLAWVSRVSGQQELAIAVPSHNRATPELRRAVGLLTEVFPLPVTLAEDDTFRSLFDKVRVAGTSLLRHAAPGTADAGYLRGCNVILNFIRGSFGSFAGHPVRAEWLHPGHHDREHHVRLHVHDFSGEGDWTIAFDLNREIFGGEQAERATGHFMALLDAFLADADALITAPDILSTDERAELEAFNATAAPLPRTTVLDDFQSIARTRPEATAVRCGNERLSYLELDQLAGAIAAMLRASGTAPGDRIGILRTRSIETVASILGVLKAGCAFVPLDPAWPAARIAYVLENAAISLVLVDPASEVALPADVTTLTPEQAALSADSSPDDVLAPPSLAACAYVLYTSGSTGKPKGVVIEHSALAHYIGWARRTYVTADPLAFPLFSPLTFDLTITSLFVPLTSGGTIVVYPETDERADLALVDVADDDQVDIIKLTPSHVRLLEQHDLTTSRARQLILGGEGLTAEMVRRIARIFGGDVLIHNEYGPTEATVGCVVHSFRAEEPQGEVVPIGRPIDNMRAWVLDAEGRLVPDGVVGELFLGGAGLAAGYQGAPERTAERFVPSVVDHAGRVYRTGDLARRNAAGLLEYCGRNDVQLKIRGARIEPGEIEAVLVTHPLVDACVVTGSRRTGEPARPERHCARCGLPSTYPDIDFDAGDLCRLCRSFDSYEARARQYFRTLEDLKAIIGGATDGQGQQCLVLFSGGKDSTYMLCRLVDLGFRVIAFTLDNGFISDQAKANIRRVVEHLGVEHMFATTPAMNRIFVDSLDRHANVCHGCFKTIYTLAMQEAEKRRIPFIVTGLSRGQLFETRLTEELWTDPLIDAQEIDRTVLQARKAYHRVDDAPRRLLDTELLQQDRVFEEVQILDFYRYTDVELDEMLAYLARRVPWVRPKDTGRSTNCLINDVGIYVHQRRRGYHNYALPYSWDVRLGHKQRDAALAELDDDIDDDRVRAILDQIGYKSPITEPEELRLVAYYEARSEVPEAELLAHLRQRLPAYLVPSHFVRLDAIPLTRNGKVDRAALPAPDAARQRGPEPFTAPRTPIERALARLWTEALRLDRVGIHDDFFKLGGDSILAIQIVARAHKAGLRLSPGDIFETLTIAGLAARCSTSAGGATAPRRTGPVTLTPAQSWYLDPLQSVVDHWNQAVHVRLPEPVPLADLRAALETLAERHDALRLAFAKTEDGWRASVEASTVAPSVTPAFDIDAARKTADQPFDLTRPPLLRVAAIGEDDTAGELLLTAHHLVVDAVSWSILLEDLAQLLRDPTSLALAPPAPSLARCGEAFTADASTSTALAELPYWRDALTREVSDLLPSAASAPDLVAGEATVTVRLDRETTRALLDEVPRRGRIRVQELLLAALGQTLAGWTDDRSLRFWLEGHGREALDADVDLARAVGWFTSLFPLALTLPGDDAPAALLRAVKEQLRAVPRRGIGYGMLRHTGTDDVRQELARLEQPGLVFNYLGDVDRLLSTAGAFRPAGPLELLRGRQARRRFPLEVVAWIIDGQLTVDWAFPSAGLATAEAQSLADRLLANVQGLVAHCRADAGVKAEAGDFPLARLDAARMEKLAAALGRADAAASRGSGT